MAASNFVIGNITAAPTYSTTDWHGVVRNPLGQSSIIWDPAGNYANGVNGSTNPVTLQYPLNGTFVSIGINGSFLCVPPPPGLVYTYVVQVLLNNQLVLQSAANNIGKTGTQSIALTQLYLLRPNPSNTQLPVRLSGDFQFQLVVTTTTGQVTLQAQQVPRLEIAFVKGPCPNNPQGRDPNNRVVANFDGMYPIGLLRLFFPSLEEIAGIPQGVAPETWYLQRAVNTVWNYGGNPNQNPNVRIPAPIRYDCINGSNSYGVSIYGSGTFQLGRWMRGYFTAVNCQDLAAILQLACNILIRNQTGLEVVASRWVEQAPHGYITPGTLIGWQQYPNCNNPFWANPKSRSSNPQVPNNQIDPLDGDPLSKFAGHSWVEVMQPGGVQPMVLDATRGVATDNGNPESGASNRVQYLTNSQIQTITVPNTQGNAITLSPNVPLGDCAQSPDSDPFIQGAIGVTRIGITVFNAIEPITQFKEISAMTAPLQDLLQRLETPNSQHQYVNADLSIPKIQQIMQGRHLTPSSTISEYLVGATGSQELVAFTLESVVYFIEISAFLHHKDPLTAAIHRLSSFQNPSQDCAQPTPDQIGDISYEATREVFFIRDNVFARVFTEALPLSPDARNELTEIARLLDAHMITSLAALPHMPIPEPRLLVGPPRSVRVGDVFVLSLDAQSLEDTLREHAAEVSDSKIVQWHGPKYFDGRFEFTAAGVGEAEVVLVAVHSRVLLPGVKRIKIVVEA